MHSPAGNLTIMRRKKKKKKKKVTSGRDGDEDVRTGTEAVGENQGEAEGPPH
jgi:hypothetical protein